MKQNYLRNRPFLAIDFTFHPAQGVRTETPGWKNEPNNVRMNEAPYVVMRISNSVLRRATLIIDVMNDTIVKNRFEGNTTDAEVTEHFLKKYASRIEELKRSWTEELAAA